MGLGGWIVFGVLVLLLVAAVNARSNRQRQSGSLEPPPARARRSRTAARRAPLPAPRQAASAPRATRPPQPAKSKAKAKSKQAKPTEWDGERPPTRKADALALMEKGYLLERRWGSRFTGGDEWFLWTGFFTEDWAKNYIITAGLGKALVRDQKVVDMSHLYPSGPETHWAHVRYVARKITVKEPE